MSDKRKSLQEQIERLERQIFIVTEDSEALDKVRSRDPSDVSPEDTSIESLEKQVEELERKLRSLQ